MHPVQDVVGGPGSVSTDQDLPARAGTATMAGQLTQRLAQDGDVVLGRVGPGVPGPQQQCQRLPAALGAVVDKRAQRVESVAPL